MKFKTVSRIFELLFSSAVIADGWTIVWHAGEPLVLPISFYEQAFQIIDELNMDKIKVSHAFQTNATLITQEWCEFFKRHNVNVGVSLDGPEYIHNINRVDRANRGTFKRVLQGVTLLQENAISYTMIAVITKETVKYPDELWEFFTALRPISLGFNPEEIEGCNTASSLGTDEDVQSYKRFFKRFLELSAQTQNPIQIREIETLTRHVDHGSDELRSQTNQPLCILSFDCDGNFSTFSPELLTMTHPVYKNFIFGNVFDSNIESMLTNEKFIEVNAQLQRGVTRCQQTCDYFMFCGGGHPSNKISENGTFDSTETLACRLRVKAATDAFIEHWEEIYGLSSHA
jgi:uncharacterized protein